MMDSKNPVDVIVIMVRFVAVATLGITTIPMIALVESITFVIQIHCRKYAEYRLDGIHKNIPTFTGGRTLMMDSKNPVDVIVIMVRFVAVATLGITTIPMIALVESITFVIQIHCRKYAEYRMKTVNPHIIFLQKKNDTMATIANETMATIARRPGN